jgi:hypothetical protein
VKRQVLLQFAATGSTAAIGNSDIRTCAQIIASRFINRSDRGFGRDRRLIGAQVLSGRRITSTAVWLCNNHEGRHPKNKADCREGVTSLCGSSLPPTRSKCRPSRLCNNRHSRNFQSRKNFTARRGIMTVSLRAGRCRRSRLRPATPAGPNRCRASMLPNSSALRRKNEAARFSRLFATTWTRERPAEATPATPPADTKTAPRRGEAARSIQDRKLAFVNGPVDRKTVSPDHLGGGAHHRHAFRPSRRGHGAGHRGRL